MTFFLAAIRSPPNQGIGAVAAPYQGREMAFPSDSAAVARCGEFYELA